MPQDDPYAKIATPVDPYAAIATPIAAPVSQQPSGMLSQLSQGVRNLGEGAIKGISNTSQNVLNMIAPKGSFFNSDPAEPAPHGAMQKLGYGGEQVGEFFLPGVDGEALATKVAPYLKAAGTAAAPLAKLGAAALTTGAVNKAQGGSFGAGALAGGAGGALGLGMKAIAPIAAESAMGVRGVDRAYNRTPGTTLLSETKGINPGSIAKQAGDKVAQYSDQLNDAAQASQVPVSLQPARQTASSLLDSAIKRNNDSTTKQVRTLADQLQTRGTALIPGLVSADEGLALKRGVSDLKTSWNPATATDFSNRAVDQTLHAMHPELAAAIPGYQDLNAKLSSLIPVQQRALSKDLNAGWIQRSMDRMGAHTGALSAPLAAAAYGGTHGGLLGAVGGGIAGLAGTELLSTPATRMALARVGNSPLTSKYAIPGVTSSLLQMNRPK